MGTTFKIYLPCVPDQPSRHRSSRNRVRTIVLCGTETVLLVEDEEASAPGSGRISQPYADTTFWKPETAWTPYRSPRITARQFIWRSLTS